MSEKQSTSAQIRVLIAEGATNDQIVERLKCKRSLVQLVRWQWNNPERVKEYDKRKKRRKALAKTKAKKAASIKPVVQLPLFDAVNHPPHYTDGGVETITFIEAKGLDYHLGNAVKYISRAGKKTLDEKEDLKKAIWYINRRLETLSK